MILRDVPVEIHQTAMSCLQTMTLTLYAVLMIDQKVWEESLEGAGP